MFSNEKWFGAEAGFYPETIDQSLRFEDGDSPYLTRTPASAGSRTTWTWSGWIKRGLLTTGSPTMFSSATNYDQIRFDASDRIIFAVYTNNGATNVGTFTTKQNFRDTTNWYHVVAVWDTTNATAGDRQRLYINGKRVLNDDLTITATPSSSAVSNFNNEQMSVGRRESTNNIYMDGYMAEVNFLDGTAVSHTQDSNGDYILDEFGEMKNGVWIPKAYSGSYGTTGFRLTFADSSSLGDDTSGNTNDFTSSGLASTDVVPDSPTNNFCTYSNLYSWALTNTTLSEGNLKSTETGTTFGVKGIGTIAVNSGKWYFETHPHLMGNANYANIGVIDVSEMTTTTGTGSDTGKFKAICYASYQGRKSAYGTGVDSSITLDGLGQSAYGDSWGATDIIGVALDIDNDAIYFSKNGTWQNSATSSEISAGTTTNSAYTGKLSGLTWTVAQGNGLNANNFGFTLNAGQDPSFAGYLTGADIGTETPSEGAGVFKYAPPTGFLALCSANLPDTTLSPNQSEQADDYFNTVLYTGNGSTTQNINIGFNPDWVWIKSRSSNTGHHSLIDSLRGDIALNSNQTIAEYSVADFNFNTDNTIDVPYYASDYSMNTNTATYVAWNWLAGEAPTVDNSASAGAIATSGSVKIDGSNKSDAMAGTIAVTRLSANTKSGISIITYTGSGANGTLPHGLTSAPEMIFFKKRDTVTSWMVYNKTNGNNRFLYLDLNNGQTGTDSSYFNNTDPSSTVISLGTYHRNNSSTKTYVAYAFHSVEGYSKIGTYTGNSSTDGTFVYTGFRPAWILIKNITATGQWFMLDNKRIGYNGANYRLLADDVLQEYSGASSNILDILSNGFKLRQNSSNYNTSNTYIYLAFAEMPFKFSNAR